MKQKEVSIKTPLEIWKEKNPDISEQEFNDLLNSVRQNFSAMPDRPARLEYLKNFCDWKRDEHKIAVYLSYFVYDAIDFYYKEKDPDKPEHYFLKNKPLSIIKSEINQRGALAVWDEYKGYIPLNIRNTRKHKLYSMNLLLEIYNNLYKPIIDTFPAGDKQKESKQPEKKPLAEKINWKAGEDILRTHLEKLRDDNFIQYNNIDEVMSGSEIAIFIKHKTYTSPCQNILALYDLWNEKKYISDYTDREGKRQYKEFMENVFNHYFKGIIKPIKHKSMKSIYSERIKKITDVKKHLESILI